MRQPSAQGEIINFRNLPATRHAVEFVGGDHGEVPFSLIVVRSPAGAGPRLHRHPYSEVFVVEYGRATFRLGDTRIVVPAGHVVVAPSNVPHGFENSGRGELRLIAIHGAGRFDTEWLEDGDRDWASRAPASPRR
jgi:mannose-6-phosphate isomerase-like protein (cupin superfamily)